MLERKKVDHRWLYLLMDLKLNNGVDKADQRAKIQH
jgi:hypothetical protein